MEEIYNIFIITGILLFILILVLYDFPFYNYLKQEFIQLLLAIFLLIIIYCDNLSGLIYSLVLLLIYYEIYKKIDLQKNKKKNINYDNNNKYMLNTLLQNNVEKFSEYNKKISDNCIELDYINETRLDKAQNNIINNDEYDIDISTLNKEADIIYGVQGLNINLEESKIEGYNLK